MRISDLEKYLKFDVLTASGVCLLNIDGSVIVADGKVTNPLAKMKFGNFMADCLHFGIFQLNDFIEFAQDKWDDYAPAYLEYAISCTA